MIKRENVTPEALSVEDAYRLIGIGRTKFYELVKDERIALRKMGRRTLVLRADLMNLLQSLPSHAA